MTSPYRIDLIAGFARPYPPYSSVGSIGRGGIGDALIASEGDILHNEATVRAIQSALVGQNIPVDGSSVASAGIDGIWGPNTQNAVLAFQIIHNFPQNSQDGFPGPETLDALGVTVSAAPSGGGGGSPAPVVSPPSAAPAIGASSPLVKILIAGAAGVAALFAYAHSKKKGRR